MKRMKKYDSSDWGAHPDEVSNQFLRGLVATGLLVALQRNDSSSAVPAQEILRSALQGGTALAAGTAAAGALQQRQYGTAALSVAFGAVGVLTLEKLLKPSRRTNPHKD